VIDMKVGFTINLGVTKKAGTDKYEFLRLDSSEHENGMDALRELYNFLKQFDHPDIKRFVKAFYGSRVKPEVAEEKKKLKQLDEAD